MILDIHTPTPEPLSPGVGTPASPAESAIGSHASQNGNYVLIADDDPGVHHLLGLTLRPLSCEVKSAYGGHEALARIAERRPGLVLLDLDMPDLSGLEVLARLSQRDETADIPVMIYSCQALVAQRTGYQWPPQVVRVLEKSNVRPKELRALIRTQLGL